MNHALRRTAPAAVAALLCTGVVAGCGSGNTPAAGGGTTPSTTPTSPIAASSATSPTTPTSTPPMGITGLLYYVVKTPLGDRITAEQHALSGSPLTAVQGTTPVDPDYRNLVPAGSLGAARVGGGRITIVVQQAGASLPATQAKLAVQQVLYSANAANGTAAKPLPVHFVTASGKDSTYLGQPSVEQPGKQLQTLSLMSVLSPAEGTTLPAAKTTFSGVGSSFEATVGWKITDGSGRSVLHGSTMSAGWMDKLYPWKVTVDLSKLAAGSYTFTASTDDASEGEGGGPVTDTKTFTIG